MNEPYYAQVGELVTAFSNGYWRVTKVETAFHTYYDTYMPQFTVVREYTGNGKRRVSKPETTFWVRPALPTLKYKIDALEEQISRYRAIEKRIIEEQS